MKRSKLRGHQVVCSAFIETWAKFLIVMCPRFKVWRVPWGRAEYGEILEETLIREMQEETGVTFTNPKFLGFWQDTQIHITGNRQTSRLIMFYHVQTEDELTLDPDEAEDHKWVTIEELKNIENKEWALDDLFRRNPDLLYNISHEN